jgi:hypothetical protein
MITVEHLTKTYRLGVLGSRTLQADVARYWDRLRGRTGAIEGQHARRVGETFWALDDVSSTCGRAKSFGCDNSLSVVTPTLQWRYSTAARDTA